MINFYQKFAVTTTAAALSFAMIEGNTTSAQAAIISFTNRVSFNAVLDAESSLKRVENWDSFAEGAVFPNNTTVNGITYFSSVETAIVTNNFLPLSSPNTLGRTPLEFFTSTDSITFGFDTPINAFGISFNTFATALGAYKITTSLGDVALSAFNPFPGFLTGQFAGLISDTPFTEATISVLNAGNEPNLSFTLDDLTFVSTSVPEPSTTLGISILGLTLLLKRKLASSQKA